MLNYPYSPPSDFDLDSPPPVRLWPAWIFLAPSAVCLTGAEPIEGLGMMKALFPLLLFSALMLKGNPVLANFSIAIARVFSISLVASFLFRKGLGFGDVDHVIWVVCFLCGSFLTNPPAENGFSHLRKPV